VAVRGARPAAAEGRSDWLDVAWECDRHRYIYGLIPSGEREVGYVEGRSFVLEPRHADGKSELMPDQAAELERVGVDVIIAGPFEALQAAKQSTNRVPIIMTPAARASIVRKGILPGSRK
jgi:hypothetical protein